MTVRTAAEDDVQSEGVSPGTFSVLDLNPLTAKFYIGGAPGSAGVSCTWGCFIGMSISLMLCFLFGSWRV